jgi:aryl-alcohol dehydrogenase-like predicted oxidoreductase
MLYHPLPGCEEKVSVIGLGGHEFLPDGRSRGFNEDFKRAVTPGEIFDGFGAQRRREVLAAAFESGINFLDVTIDSEKEALGRNLREVPPPFDIYIQTRPEGMCWGYDPGNPKMADLPILREEVQRVLRLLRRPRLDILNLGFTIAALQRDSDFLDRLGENLAVLKREGLIRWASADTFDGQSLYLSAIASGHFDAMFINFSCGDCGALERVLPAARQRGMMVNTREAFMKTALFSLGEKAGITDRSALARASIRWNLAAPGITTVVVGAHDARQLRDNVRAVESSPATPAEDALLQRLRQSPAFQQHCAQRREAFAK